MIAHHRVSDGCQMCGGSLVDDDANGTWVSKPDMRWVPVCRFSLTHPLPVKTIKVPVCGECYRTLATPEGINALAQAVNGRGASQWSIASFPRTISQPNSEGRSGP